jgi:2-dehydro-3-deoxyphosphogluconate aldolase / (4S)-4-hydroxy-2-oxoglutarate aldolase
MSSSKLKVLHRIQDSGLIAILRAEVAGQVSQVVEACLAGGASIIEITFTVPGAAGLIEELVKRYGSGDIIIGAGTVLDPETARIAILSGAQFIVSPALNIDTARLCNRYRVPHIPGTGSVKEIIEAMESGADIVKIFPSETLGPAFAKAVLGPLPHALLVPTGGVSVDNTAEWIRSGCIAVGASGYLTAPAKTGDFKGITDLAERFLAEIKRARA